MTSFKFQIQLACEVQKPLFLHEREAHREMVKLLQAYKDRCGYLPWDLSLRYPFSVPFSRGLPPSVIHCFTGTSEEAKKYLEMGCYIGLTGECNLIDLHKQGI